MDGSSAGMWSNVSGVFFRPCERGAGLKTSARRVSSLSSGGVAVFVDHTAKDLGPLDSPTVLAADVDVAPRVRNPMLNFFSHDPRIVV